MPLCIDCVISNKKIIFCYLNGYIIPNITFHHKIHINVWNSLTEYTTHGNNTIIILN